MLTPHDRRYGGTGLGLWITKNILAMMQGDAKVKSKLGRGSNFIVAFPAKVVPEVSAILGTEGDESVPGSESLKGRTYLLLDDISENTFVMAQILGKFGARATESHDGDDALDRFKRRPEDFDGVITDLRMPGMSGQTFISEVRKFEKDTNRSHAVPILVVTAENSGEEKRLCLTLGATDFLLKPAKVRDLVSTLVKLHDKENKKHAPSKRRVLIVDDDATSSRFMSAVLTKEGHTCVNTFSVAEGLSELQKPDATFDVIMLDNMLGDGTGPDFLRAVVRLNREKMPKVVSVSGNSVGDQRQAYETAAGLRVDGYLQKPAQKRDVVAMVQFI